MKREKKVVKPNVSLYYSIESNENPYVFKYIIFKKQILSRDRTHPFRPILKRE